MEGALGRAGVVVLRWRAEPGWPVELAVPGPETLGGTPEEVAGGALHLSDLIHADDRPRVEIALAALVRAGGRSVIRDVRVARPAGATRRVELRVAVVRDQAGRVTHFEGIVLEVDADQARVTPAELLDAIPIPVFYKDAHLIYRGCNTAFERMLGRSRSEIIGAGLYDLSPPALARTYEEMDRALLTSGGVQIYEEQVRFADGTRHDVVFHKAAFLDDAGTVAGLIGAMLDITDRNRVARELQEAHEQLEDRVQQRTQELTRALGDLEREIDERRVIERRLRVVLDTAPVGISLHLAPDGRIGLRNRAAEAILGGLGVNDVLLPNGEAIPPERQPLSRSLRGETLSGFEVLVRQPSGRESYVLEHAAPIRDAEGQSGGAVIAFQDITPIREQERQRDEFIAALAHELKTPVTTIQGYAELLQRMSPAEREVHAAKAIESIIAQAHRINRRVQEMLEVARFRRARAGLLSSRFDLGELAGQVVGRARALCPAHRFAYRREGPVSVEADHERIEEVLVNLLDNAVEASPTGGEIEVRVWSGGGEALASVRDHGPGVPKVRQPHVFEPFYEAIPSGALGYRSVVALAPYLSWLIIEQHRGRIWVESEEGAGSTFLFALPLVGGGGGKVRVGTDASP